MNRKNVLINFIGRLARRFRILQEVWIQPWWGSGGVAAVPLWALDTFVLVIKLCSTCTVALTRVLFPPVMKNLHGETILVNEKIDRVFNRVCWNKEIFFYMVLYGRPHRKLIFFFKKITRLIYTVLYVVNGRK